MSLLLGAVALVALATVLLWRKGRLSGADSLRGPSSKPTPRPVRAREINTGLDTDRSNDANKSISLPETVTRLHLLTEEELSQASRDRLMAEIRHFRKPPATLHRLLSPQELARQSNQGLADLIRQEPVLVARILTAVNSPLYGLQQQISSVQHGIAFLGVNAIRDLATRYLLEDAVSRSSPELAPLYERIWSSSILASELCLMLLRQLGHPGTAEASTLTILYFLGDLPLINLIGAERALQIWPLPLLNRIEEQQAACGLNADIAGRFTLQEWGMPQGIILGVDRMHRVPFLRNHVRDAAGVQAIVAYLSARLCEDTQYGRDNMGKDGLFEQPEYLAAIAALDDKTRSVVTRSLHSDDYRRLRDRMGQLGARNY